jgi:hypothetical protein
MSPFLGIGRRCSARWSRCETTRQWLPGQALAKQLGRDTVRCSLVEVGLPLGF